MRAVLARWSIGGALALAVLGQWLLGQSLDWGWLCYLLGGGALILAFHLLRAEIALPVAASPAIAAGALWPLLVIVGQGCAFWAAQSRHTLWPVLLPWAFSVVAMIVGVAQVPLRVTWNWKPPTIRWAWPLLLGLGLSMAAALRFVDLEWLPSGIHGDEGEFGMIALDVMRGQGPSPFGVAFLDDPALYLHLLAPFVAVLGTNMLAIRLLSAIAGTVTVVVFYLLVRDLAGRRAGLIAALLLAGSAAHIHFSRMALNVIEAPLFACLSLWFLRRGLATQRPIWYLAAGLAGGFGCYFHFSARIVVPILGLVLIWQLAARLATPRQLAIGAGLTLLGGLLCLSPLLAHSLANPAQLSDHMTSRLVWNGWDETAARHHLAADNWLGIVGSQFRVTLAALIQTPDPDTFFGFAAAPLLSPAIAPLALLGLVALGTRPRSLSSSLLLPWFLAPFILGGVMVSNAGGFHRLLLGLLPALAAAAILLDRLIDLAMRQLPSQVGPVVAGILALAPLMAVAQGAQLYFGAAAAAYPWADTTAQGRQLATLPPGTVAYVMSAPHIFAEHGTSRYLSQQIGRQDLFNPTVTLPAQRDDSPRAIIVNPTNRDWLPLLQAYFPQAEVQELRWVDNRTTLYLLMVPARTTVVTPPGAGLSGELRPAQGGPPLRRHDATLAFMRLDSLISDERYSGTWSGWLRAPSSGDYELEVVTDGAVTLLIDGTPIVADPAATDAPHSVRQRFTFADRPYAVQLQGEWSRGEGYLALFWRGPGGEREMIPTTAFVPAP